jgi:hypothetical protein
LRGCVCLQGKSYDLNGTKYASMEYKI